MERSGGRESRMGRNMASIGDVGRGEERPQKMVICCSAFQETEGLGLGEQREPR